MQYINGSLGRDVKLSSLQKIKLGLLGKVLLDYKKNPFGNKKVFFYAFKCAVHGLQMDYPHGYAGTLTCPECIKQQATKLIFSKKSILANLRNKKKLQESEGPATISKEKAGFISKNQAVLGVSVVGLICMMGYKIYKNRQNE